MASGPLSQNSVSTQTPAVDKNGTKQEPAFYFFKRRERDA